MACLPPFYPFFSLCPCFCPFAFLLLLLCLPPFMLVVLLCSGCLSLFSCIVFVALWVLVVLLFPLRTIRKKKGAQFSCVLSCPVVCLLCKIWLSVLVKFVFVSLNVFYYAFVGGGVFAIVLPLLEKTFENTIDKFPCVNLVFYALVYVI